MSMRMIITAAALAACAAPGLSHAQHLEGRSADMPQPTADAMSVTGQVSVVYQPGGQTHIALLRSNYADSVSGNEASGERILSGLNQAALLGVSQALSQGAQSGRVDAVAVVYQFSSGDISGAFWGPVGVFVNTTEFVLDDAGRAHMRTRIQFLPDARGSAQPN